MADPYYGVDLQLPSTGGDRRSTAVLRLSGDLDINARDEVQDAMLDAAGSRSAELVVDLSAVSFIDSEAVNALLVGCAAAGGNGVRVRLTGAQGLVYRVLAIAGVFELVETLTGPHPAPAATEPDVLPFPTARPAADE